MTAGPPGCDHPGAQKSLEGLFAAIERKLRNTSCFPEVAAADDDAETRRPTSANCRWVCTLKWVTYTDGGGRQYQLPMIEFRYDCA